MALARSFRALAKLRNVPEQLKAVKAAKNDHQCECTCEECVEGECEECTHEGCDCANCDCPQHVGNSSNLSLYEARLRVLPN
jgi:hypothetical protein